MSERDREREREKERESEREREIERETTAPSLSMRGRSCSTLIVWKSPKSAHTSEYWEQASSLKSEMLST